MDTGNGDIPHVVVVGSVNMDLVIRAMRMPKPGETVRGGYFHTFPGGKGANQAVAAARLGASVSFVGRVGDDAYGKEQRSCLEAEGIGVLNLTTSDTEPTGVAVITVDAAGQNAIVISSGANNEVCLEDIEKSEPTIMRANMLVCQLEVPLDAVVAAINAAKKYNTLVLLNPAPVVPLEQELLAHVDYLVLNETEAALLLGIESGLKVGDVHAAQNAAKTLKAWGVGTVLLTLGANGVVVADGKQITHHPGKKVDAVDTTAAGDTFVGAFATAICSGRPLEESVAFAQQASAIAVTRLGAQPSIPRLHEMEQAFF